jgi:hypothetical protein
MGCWSKSSPGGVAATILAGGAISAQHRHGRPQCFGATADSDHSVGTDSSTRCKSASINGTGTAAGISVSFCRRLLSALDDASVGFSTRRDDPSNREFSSIANDR